jgi:PAS domain S-box-containing protein
MSNKLSFKSKYKISNIYLYIGLILISGIMILLRLLYPDETSLLFLIYFIMLFYLISEVLGNTAGLITAGIIEIFMIIRYFYFAGVSPQIYILSIIVLGIIVIFYYIVKSLRRGKFEKTSERERYFRSLVNLSLQPMILKNKDGDIILSSETIQDVMGLRKQELVGNNINNFVHPDDKSDYKKFYESLLANPNKIYSAQFRIKKNDRWLWVKNDGINLLTNPDIKAVVTTLQDITSQRNIDQQKADLLQKEQNARELAERAIKDRDEFLSIASHELKTPLTTVLLQIQATLRKISTQSLADFSGNDLLNSLQIAEKQSQNLSRLIKDLLNVSLASTGRLTLNREKVNLTELAESLYKKYEEEIRLSESNVDFSVGNKDIYGNWDPVRIEQAMTNIFLNALKYANGKKIKININKEENWAIFKVTDQGIGISEQDLQMIFEPFNRSNGTGIKKGLGIGLFISKQIVIAHGGDIEVESKLSKGSIFTMKLPLAR